MSEMVNRVAKVLHEIHFEVGKPNYSQAARAVIEAMREPTEKMWNAPGRSDAFVNGVLPTGEEAECIYQAMIDEALK